MTMTDVQGESPVFGLRYLEDREVEGLDIVGCVIHIGNSVTNTGSGCDDPDYDEGNSAP